MGVVYIGRMSRWLIVVTLFLAAEAHAEELHLICTGRNFIAVDNGVTWSNEIVIDMETAKVIQFETSWTLAAKHPDYLIEYSAEIDASTIKIYDRAFGPDGQFEKVFVIWTADGTVAGIYTKTGAIVIEGKCTPAEEKVF